jgi:hypothetical protein
MKFWFTERTVEYNTWSSRSSWANLSASSAG